MEFEIVTLEESDIQIIDGDRGKNYPKKSEFLKSGHTLFLNNKNLADNYIDISFGDYISQKKSDLMRKGKLERGDIVITTRGSVGNVGLFDDSILREYLRINSGMVILRNKDKEFSTNFLFNQLKSNFVQNQIETLITGSVQNQLPIRDLKKIKLLKPNISVQYKINNIIGSLDKKIEINNKIIGNLESQAQAIFKSWFVDFEPFQDGNFVEGGLGLIPEGWKVFKLEDIADISNGYSFKSRDLQDSYKNENDYRVFKQGDIKVGGGFNPDKTKSWISEKFIENNKIERFILDKNDILMCMTGVKNNVRLLGNTAYIWEENNYVLNQRVGRIRCANKKITPSFIYFLTNSQEFLNDLRGRANRGVQVNLSSKEIKRSLFVMPNEQHLNRFNKYSTLVMEMVGNLYLENYRLIKLRDTLLPKLMSGEIDVSNIKIDDEDADYE